SAMCQDVQGRLWVGTKAGLTMYDGAEFTTYSILQGLPNTWVTAVCERPDTPSTLVVGTIAGGPWEFRDGRLAQLTGEGNVSDVHADREGSIWFIMNDTRFLMRHDSLRVLALTSVVPNRGGIIELADSSGNRRLVAGFGTDLLFFSSD